MAKGAYIGVDEPKKTFLYSNGNEHTDVTGGWGVYALNTNVSSVKNATNMYFSTTVNADGQNRNRANTLNKVDVTGYSKLCFEFSNTGTTTSETSYFRSFGLVDTLPGYGGKADLYIGNYYQSYALTDDGVKEIDISGVSGEHYICFFQCITRNTQIDRVWLETEPTGVARKIKKGYVGVDTERIENGKSLTSTTGWTVNQNVTMSVENGSLKAVSNQASSTPGVYYTFSEPYPSGVLEVKFDIEMANLPAAMICPFYEDGTTPTVASASFSNDRKVLSATFDTGAHVVQRIYVFLRAPTVGGVMKIHSASVVKPNTARKIQKAYIGIGGVARPCWSGGKLAYYGAITPLSYPRQWMASASIGDYALFAGGTGSGTVPTVDAYDKALVCSTAPALAESKHYLSAATVGSYAVFAGGKTGSGSDGQKKSVDAYDRSLTKASGVPVMTLGRSAMQATTVGDCALFAGGSTTWQDETAVEVYDASLTHTSAPDLSTARSDFAATTIGNYALFAGGPLISSVEAYDKSLTKKAVTALSAARYSLAATSVGNFALFGGGRNESAVVDAYDRSLTRSIPTPLSVARYGLAATTVEGYALFVAGAGSTGANAVDVYDEHLTQTVFDPLPDSKQNHSAARVGDYALFAGGFGTGTYTNAVYAYVVA